MFEEEISSSPVRFRFALEENGALMCIGCSKKSSFCACGCCPLYLSGNL